MLERNDSAQPAPAPAIGTRASPADAVGARRRARLADRFGGRTSGGTGIDSSAVPRPKQPPGAQGPPSWWGSGDGARRRERGPAAWLKQKLRAAAAPERRDPPGAPVSSRDHMPVVHGHRAGAPHVRPSSRHSPNRSRPTKQEEAGEEVQPGHAGGGGTRAGTRGRCVLMPSKRVSRWMSESLMAVRNGTVNMRR